MLILSNLKGEAVRPRFIKGRNLGLMPSGKIMRILHHQSLKLERKESRESIVRVHPMRYLRFRVRMALWFLHPSLDYWSWFLFWHWWEFSHIGKGIHDWRDRKRPKWLMKGSKYITDWRKRARTNLIFCHLQKNKVRTTEKSILEGCREPQNRRSDDILL